MQLQPRPSATTTSGVFTCRLPQNSTAIGKAQDALSKPPCIEFYTRVLNAVSSKKNPVLEGGDLSKIFQDFLNQENGGLTRTPIPGGAGFGSTSGLIKPGKSSSNGTIYLPPGPGNWHDAVGLVGEIFHLAGSRAMYYDYELAVVVNGIPEYAAKFSQDPKRNIFDKRWEGSGSAKDRNNGGYSTFFHDIERQLCNVK